MAHLTKNFTSEAPFSPRVLEAINAAYADGWADPKKVNQASSRANSLANAAKEEIASIWGVCTEALEVVGEPNLLPFLSLQGFLTTDCQLITSTVDVGKIRAVARAFVGSKRELEVSSTGQLEKSGSLENSLISLQSTNGETGISQDFRPWSGLESSIILDATHSLPEHDHLREFKAITLDSKSWNGPDGIGFLVINDEPKFRYPLPHIAPIRTPGSYSLPLLVGSAFALTETINEKSTCYELRNQLRSHLAAVHGIQVIGGDFDSRYLSIIVDGISGEELLRSLLKKEFAVDSGSACSPDDLTPSHVIAAMGYQTEGHLRFTIHPHHTGRDIEELITVISSELESLNSKY